MNIDGCEFPDDLLYDEDGLIWARVGASGDVTVGITTIYAGLTGRLASISARSIGIEYDRGKTIGTLESGKYFGPIRTPARGVLLETNADVLAKPRRMTESVYGGGWFARLRPTNLTEDRRRLLSGDEARARLGAQIGALHVRCFAAFPDYELIEIGTECAAVLVKLNELLAHLDVGEVVHIVSDDLTAPVEMVRWSDQTHHPVVDERKEGNLFHFLVRKAH